MHTRRGLIGKALALASAYPLTSLAASGVQVAGSPARSGEPQTMDIVDAQVHVFYTLPISETLAVMDALGIRSVIIDELWSFTPDQQNSMAFPPNAALPGGARRPLSPLAQAAALQHPDRFSYMQRVDRRDPQLGELFAILGTSPGCRSVRIDLRDPAERAVIAGGGYDALFAHARQYALPVSVLGRETGRTMPIALARHPGVHFVLDHCGSPQTMAEWDEVLALGAFHNCTLKWSHGHHFIDAGAFPYPAVQAQLSRALKAFGRERVIWASDFTHERSSATWAELLFYLRESPLFDRDDKAWLLGRAARRLYRWPTPTASTATETAQSRQGGFAK